MVDTVAWHEQSLFCDCCAGRFYTNDPTFIFLCVDCSYMKKACVRCYFRSVTAELKYAPCKCIECQAFAASEKKRISKKKSWLSSEQDGFFV